MQFDIAQSQKLTACVITQDAHFEAQAGPTWCGSISCSKGGHCSCAGSLDLPRRSGGLHRLTASQHCCLSRSADQRAWLASCISSLKGSNRSLQGSFCYAVSASGKLYHQLLPLHGHEKMEGAD